MTLREYQKLPIDFRAIGLEQRNFTPYFCTPAHFIPIGSPGVDGIHFGLIRGFGETVFSVNPSCSPENVHPVADSLSDFLSLIIACGSVDAVEQAWMWDEKTFLTFVAENQPNEKQREVFDILMENADLWQMEHPYWYLREIQENFDLSKIPYTDEYYALTELPPPAPRSEKWEVYWSDDFRRQNTRSRPGEEWRLNRQFTWNGRKWLLPSVYLCSKGLVADLILRADASSICAYQDKWENNVSLTEEEQLLAAADNPLRADFRAKLIGNHKQLQEEHGIVLYYRPDSCISEFSCDMEEADAYIRHYNLDENCGYAIFRTAFLWPSARNPKLSSLELTLIPDPVSLPGPHFKTPETKSLSLTHPVTGIEYTLTVTGLETERMDPGVFGESDREYPACLTGLSYTISPDLPAGEFSLFDCFRGDTPRKVPKTEEETGFSPAISEAIAIIGGIDGPTAVFCSSAGDNTRTVCSSLSFQPREEIEWKIIFRHRFGENLTLSLL